ncbi:hypothetical protein ACFOWE_32425 [Planomonospora corallina]|uniref:WD40 repeat domain-containing protein n=1 Tax=Planomonospora corallina TaxID=1806052 RepID=A0ABV8IIR8_9ACTN
MTRLHEALGGIADEAPLVDLADRAIAGHRRRRRTTLALATAAAATATAVIAMIGMVTTTVALPGPRGDETAAQQRADGVQRADAVPDLPGGRVGVLSHAYRTPCEVDQEDPLRPPDCSAVEWRVVTGTGATYRVPQALVSTAKGWRAPVAISRDGRMLAYYSRQAQAHVVRDLVSGSEVVSPVTVKEERIGGGSMLAVSDDGRYVVFDPREGTKDPGLLIDMRTGRKLSVNGKFEVVSVKDGVAALVRYVKTDLWLMPVTGGGSPVRFDGVFIMFSELAPDGRTVAAFDFRAKGREKRTLSILDARSGRILRRVAIHGLPKGGGVSGVATWRSGSEVTIVYDGEEVSTYAVDVRTGKARRLAGYPGTLTNPTDPVLPGVAAIG